MLRAVSSDLNDIEAFVRVVEDQSFSAAARRMHVPVSSLSRKVARLEEQLGARLLHRTTRRLHLTDAGRAFFQRASRSLAELKDAEQELTMRSAKPRGKVRMTAPVDFRPLLGLVLDFLAAHPEVQIDLDLSNRHVDLVAEGYDLALRAAAVVDGSLVAQRISSSGMRLVASPAYLALRGTPRSVEELREHDAVVLGPTTEGAFWSLTSGRDTVRVPVSGRFAVNSLDGVRQAVLAGFGIGLLPERALTAELTSGALVELLPEHWPPQANIFLVYPGRRLMASAVRAFIDFLMERLRESPLASGTWPPERGNESS